jgi:uncharacterized membrane protein HdeD (DUF308 family)
LWSAGKISGILRSLIYFTAGTFFLVSAVFPLLYQKLIIGGGTIIYGIFRLYKAFSTEKESDEDDEE